MGTTTSGLDQDQLHRIEFIPVKLSNSPWFRRSQTQGRNLTTVILLYGHVVKLPSEHVCIYIYIYIPIYIYTYMCMYIYAALNFGQKRFFVQWSIVNSETHNSAQSAEKK